MPVESPSARATTHLANERTFLAWFRTGLTLIALGLAVAQFLSGDTGWSVTALAIVMVVAGAGLVVTGLYRYRRNLARIDADEFAPAGLSVVLASVAALGAAGLAVVFVLTISRP
jgi:putative membrane protein